jgi:hypothetical protein
VDKTPQHVGYVKREIAKCRLEASKTLESPPPPQGSKFLKTLDPHPIRKSGDSMHFPSRKSHEGNPNGMFFVYRSSVGLNNAVMNRTCEAKEEESSTW